MSLPFKHSTPFQVFQKCLVVFIAVLVIGSACQVMEAQDYRALREKLRQRQVNTRNEIEDLKSRIEAAERDLRNTDRRYDQVYAEFRSLEREIRLRDALIQKLQDERAHIQEEIQLLQKDYELTENDLSSLEQNYKKSLRYLYKRGRLSDAAILLSSVSINQMLIRAKYLELFDLHLRKLEDNIHAKQEQLKDKERQLGAAKIENERNEAEITQEKRNLSRRRSTQEENIVTLKKDRQRTQNRLKKLENEISSFKETLTELIENEEEVRQKLVAQYNRLERERLRKLREAEAMANSEERARLVEKYSRPTPKTNVIETIDFGSLEQTFAQQKGSLRTPVEGGVIVRQKGISRDPLYGTKIDYPGVDIATKAGTPVRVVHDGLVFRTIPMAGYGDVVFVKHGKYITAYGNLSRIQVRENSFVRAGEIIGRSGDKNAPKGETLFFMIRESKSYLNPAEWIKSR